jgi:cellulose synthase/poly-beta-1,6-N-acetylglucosamine synthase-like glycosyltransferase
MITTIIPTYRRPQLLVRAVRSVLRQTNPDFQVVVYDNASGDETAAVVARLASEDPRVHYRVQDHNLGGPANLLFGLSRVETDYASVLCDDDLLLPHFYEQALAGFAAYPDAGFVASPVMMVDQAGRVLRLIGQDWPPGRYDVPRAMLRMAERDHFIVTGTLFRRDAIEIRPTDVETWTSTDLNLMLRVSGRHPIVVAPRPAAVFTVHAESPSSFPRLKQYWPGWTRLIANASEDERVPPAARAAAKRGLERRLATALLAVGLFSISRGDDQETTEAATVLVARYQQRVRAAFLRVVAGVCRIVPGTRRLLRIATTWLRWRQRGDYRREQAELDSYSGLLDVPRQAELKNAA